MVSGANLFFHSCGRVLLELRPRVYALISLNSLEIFLEAVFLWIMPFLAAFWNADWVCFIKSPTESSPASLAARNFFSRVLRRVLADLFLRRLTWLCFARFFADL